MDKVEYLNNTKLRTIKMMNAYGLDHDSFMTELKKYNGIVTGSFMYVNFFPNNVADCGDIDVYIYEPSVDRARDYHPFERYLLDKFVCSHTFCKSSSPYGKAGYTFVNNIHYARKYFTKNIDVNFILIDRPCVPYVNNCFDLDCCKIIYDGETVTTYDFDSIINHHTNVNLCKYDNCGKLFIGKKIRKYAKRLPFIKLYMMVDVYKYLAGSLTTFPTYIYRQQVKRLLPAGNGTYRTIKTDIVDTSYCAVNYINLYTKLVSDISKMVDLDSIIKPNIKQNIKQNIEPNTEPNIVPNIDLGSIVITPQVLHLVQLLVTLERVEKYRKRGMIQFNFVKPILHNYIINGLVKLDTANFNIDTLDNLDVSIAENTNINVYLDQTKTMSSFKNYYRTYKCGGNIDIAKIFHLIYLTYWNFILEVGAKESMLTNLSVSSFEFEPQTGNIYPIIKTGSN